MDIITAVLILAAIASVLSTVGMFIFGLTDIRQLAFIRKINARIDDFKQQNIGAQLGEWLLSLEEVDGKPVAKMALLARIVGHEIATSFSMAAKGIASGESRTLRSVEKAVLEGLETPETKALLAFADKIGLDREYAGPILEVLEKRGLLPQVLKNNGGSRDSGWQI